MKLIIPLLSAFILSSSDLYCQCTTFLFKPTCDNVVYASGCPTWQDGCGAGWTRSHGTPQIDSVFWGKSKDGSRNIYLDYGYMWSAIISSVLHGEGMYIPYSFAQNIQATLVLTLLTDGGNGSDQVLVYAANGLTKHSLAECGDAIPTISQKQLITSIVGSNNGWTTYNISFTPNANYSYLWIYPQAPSTTQFNLNVSEVQICSNTWCAGNIIINTGVVPSNQVTAGTIQVGSTAGSGGSGTVTIQPDQSTGLIAVNEIDLFPEFQATVTTGTFYAMNTICGYVPTGPDEVNYDTITVSLPTGQTSGNSDSARALYSTITEDDNVSSSFDLQKLSVFPTISNGVINVTGKPNDLENAELIVSDQLGKIVYRSLYKGNTPAVLNLGYLHNGIYFLQIKKGIKVTTKKFVIIK